MRKINKLTNIALIFMLIGTILYPRLSYSLRVPQDSNFSEKFNKIAHMLTGQDGSQVGVSGMEIALLGDMIDDPVVISALSNVRRHIKNPAYLRNAILVYLYDQKLFERLISEHVKEKIIDNIGWGLSLFPETAKRILDDGFPFNGKWLEKTTTGWFVGGGIFSTYNSLKTNNMKEIKEMGLLDVAIKNFDFAISFRDFPEETKMLVRTFRISPYRKNIRSLALILKEYPEIAKRIFNDPYLKKLDYNTIAAIKILMHKYKASAYEIKDILISLDEGKWSKFIVHMPENKIFEHLEAFYLDRKRAMYFHHKYPYDARWLDAFLVQADRKTIYEKMLKAGFSELQINNDTIDAYNSNPDLFIWLFKASLTNGVLECLIMGDDSRITLFKNPVEYYIVMDWLKKMGLISPGIDMSTAKKISNLCKEIAMFLSDNIEKAEESAKWALSYYSKGIIPLDKVGDLCKARFKKRKGLEAALKIGIPVNDMDINIADAFTSGYDAKTAKPALYLNKQNIPITKESLKAIKDFPEAFKRIKEANLPFICDRNWAELLDKKPEVIELWKSLYKFNNKAVHKPIPGFISFPFITNIEIDTVHPNNFTISLGFTKEDLKQDWTKNIVDNHTNGLASAYVKINIKDDMVIVEELQSDVDFRKSPPEVQKLYKDRLEIAILTLEQIFENMKIVILPSAVLLKHWEALNPETAYRIYAEIPNKLGYEIRRFSKPPIEVSSVSRQEISEHWLWVKDIPKKSKRGQTSIVLPPKKYLTSL